MARSNERQASGMLSDARIVRLRRLSSDNRKPVRMLRWQGRRGGAPRLGIRLVKATVTELAEVLRRDSLYEIYGGYKVSRSSPTRRSRSLFNVPSVTDWGSSMGWL